MFKWFARTTRRLEMMLVWVGTFTVLWAVMSWLSKQISVFGTLNWPEAIFLGLGATLLTAIVVTGSLALWRVFRPRPASPPPPASDGLTVTATATIRDVPSEEQLRRGIYVGRIEANTGRLETDNIIEIEIIGFNGTGRRIGITDIAGAIRTWMPVAGDDGREAKGERALPTPVLTNPAGPLGIPAHSEFMLVLEQVLRPAVAAEMLAALGPEKVELDLSQLVITAVYKNDDPSVTTTVPLWNLGLIQAERLWTCKIISAAGMASVKPIASIGKPGEHGVEPSPPDTAPQVSLTPKEKDQGKGILVALADAIRESWWPLFENARWLHGAQDVYAQSLPTLPALREQAIQVTKEIHDFHNAHEHMLAIMGLNLSDFAQAAAGTHEPIRHYIDRADVLGDALSNHVIMLLQGDAQPVRDAFSVYNITLSHLQRTVTRMRKEIDA